MPKAFFEEQTEASRVKALIVSKYFAAWANVMKNQHAAKIGYVDLYAGPGRYRNGAKSTPLMVLETAVKDPKIAAKFIGLFNDSDPNHVDSLKTAIDALPDIKNLRHAPSVACNEVGEATVQYFERVKTIPLFTFIDPFGYKGLSLRLINAVVKDWGCDCVFFLNYTRVNMGIRNPKITDHMEALLGPARLEDLRARVDGKTADQRESMLVEAVGEALQEMGGSYILPFRFVGEGNRASHYLFFISKHVLGYSIMKEIMHGMTDRKDADEVAERFEYANVTDPALQLLFGYARPLEGLGEELLALHRGKRLSVSHIYENHHVGTWFVKKNYKSVLMELEAQDRIKVTDPEGKPRKKGTLADRLLVTFPRA
jgi:three-Cys-motif partner protein